MNPFVIIDLARTVVRLGPEGRRWARALQKSQARHPDRPKLALLDDAADRRDLLEKLVLCDRTFRDCFPQRLPEGFGRTRDEVYARWVPFALINLLLRCRLLEAYSISWDRDAAVRLTSLVFLMREWNDIRERFGPDAAFDAMRTEPEPEPPLFLNRHLFRWTYGLVPWSEFPDLSGLWRFWQERPLEPVRPASTAGSLETIAAMSLTVGFAIMVPKVPENLGRAARPFGRWLYGLDQLSDYHRDKAAQTPTYFTAHPDPISEIRKITAACEEHLRKEAPNPERIVPLMRHLTGLAVDAHEKGWHIESEYFGAPDVPS